MINNTSIGKQMHIGKEDKHGKSVVGLVFSVFKKKKKGKKDDGIFWFLQSKRWRSLKSDHSLRPAPLGYCCYACTIQNVLD